MTLTRPNERRVVLYGCRGRTDQFVGVPQHLGARGWQHNYERLWSDEIAFGGHTHPHVVRDASLVACADLTHNGHARVFELANRYHTPAALLVDGVVEWSHTMLNEWLGPRHLRPASSGVVLAMGTLQQALLKAMGNAVRPTGLPRLEGFATRVDHARANRRDDPRPRLLVATANCPAMVPAARHRIQACLRAIRSACERAAIEPLWRLTGGLAEELGVDTDPRPLHESLATCDAMIASASTIIVEGMLAGIPVGVLHPHPWPLWIPGAWVWAPPFEIDQHERDLLAPKLDLSKPATDAAEHHIRETLASQSLGDALPEPDTRPSCDEFIQSLLHPDSHQRGVQQALLRVTHTEGSPANVAHALIAEAIDPSSTTPRPAPASHGLTRVTTPKPIPDRRRAVSVIVQQRWAVPAIAAWSRHMGNTFNQHPSLGFDFETIHVVTDPTSYTHDYPDFDPSDDRQHILTFEPTEGDAERLDRLTDTLASLSPDILIPNDSDLAAAACARLRARGVRTLAIHHAHTTRTAQRLARFPAHDALLVAGTEGQAPRDLHDDDTIQIDGFMRYGVPVTPAPARPEGAPLRLISVSTIVQDPANCFRLIDLLEALRTGNTPCTLDLIGDGPDRDEWTERVGQQGWGPELVRVPGRLPPHAIAERLQHADVFVSLASREGAGLAAIEAMGAGLLACVTNTGAGASRWARDNEHAIVVPVDDIKAMADRLASVARNDPERERLARAGQARVVEAGLDAASTARTLADAMARALDRPSRPHALPRLPIPPRGACLDAGVWLASDAPERATVDPVRTDQSLEQVLRDARAGNVAYASPAQGCDAVLIRASDPRPGTQAIEAWRASGIAVAISPTLHPSASDGAFDRAIEHLRVEGCQRIGVWIAPGSAHLLRRAVDAWPQVLAVVDEQAEQGDSCLGIPAHPLTEAVEAHNLDGVLILTPRAQHPGHVAAQAQPAPSDPRPHAARKMNLKVAVLGNQTHEPRPK